MGNTDNTLEKRRARVDAAIALKEADRVPFAPKMGLAYTRMGNINKYEAMVDYRDLEDGVRNFLTKYEVDLFRMPSAMPIRALEFLECEHVNWPGPHSGLDKNLGVQILDKEYLHDDEYDDFLIDPTHFFMTKLYPRRHKKLKGLEKLCFNNVFAGHLGTFVPYTDPEVQEAFFAMNAAGTEVKRWMEARKKVAEIAVSLDTPLSNQGGQDAPYDMFADCIRGYLNVPMDLFTVPEKVERAIEIMEHYGNQAVDAMAERGGVDSCFMPLHGGTDDFMSEETYRKYYWPSLQRIIERIISKGITPVAFCEGKYDTRLEILREVPKGKVMYMFEKVDMAKAKKVLGDTACICGNIPGAMLWHGSKEEVIEETKRLIDCCADGGGFIMDCSMSLDDFNPENMDAWYETTLKYGKY